MLFEESREELNWWLERKKDMAKETKKKRELVMRVATAHAEQLAAGAFRAALTDFLLEARKTLQVVKVAALTHAADRFQLLATRLGETEAEAKQYMEAADRCFREARTALGHVTG